MRKISLFATAILTFCLHLSSSSLVAQCVIDTTLPYIPGIYPTDLPPAQGCEFYDFDITFVLPRDTTVELFPGQTLTIPFNTFTIDGLAGLPQGMDWECNLAPDCVYDVNPNNPNPDSLGCIRIFGTPSIPITYQIVAYITANLAVVGDQASTFEMVLDVTPCQFAGDCYTYSVSSNCQPASLTVNNQVASNGKAGFDYAWSFTGPNGFSYVTSDENPLPQSLSDPGDYYLDYTATVDTTGFILTEATISNVNCDDFLDGGDLYWKLIDPSDSVWVNTDGNQVVNGGDNLPVVTNLPDIVLDTGTYEFQVWDHDDIGNDDGCADGTGGGGASIFFTIPYTGSLPLTITNNGLTVTFDILHPIDTIVCADTIHIDSLPAVPAINVMGDPVICDGDTGMLLTDFADSIQWYRDGLPLLNAHDPMLTLTEAGAYTVEVIDPLTLCMRLSNELIVTVNSTPVPSIAYDGNGNFSIASPNPDYAYLWYKDGDSVGTGSTFTGNSTGTYHATATDMLTGCESGPSAPIDATITGLDQLRDFISGFRVYPNPNEGIFTIEMGLLQPQSLRLRLFDLYGKVVYETDFERQSGSFHKTIQGLQLPAGVYLMTLDLEAGSLHRKIIVR